MASMRNSNYYEMGLLHPRRQPFNAKPFKDGYSEDLSAVDENGCVDVPEGPGLGVEYDWDFISAHEVDRTEYR